MSSFARPVLPEIPLQTLLSPPPCFRRLAERARSMPQPEQLASFAVAALIYEANLSPKPGLVDLRGSGAHTDLSLELMHRSARSLYPCFKAIAEASQNMAPSQKAREELARIGREGERAMFAATGGANTHKGAIWALGLLVAGTVLAGKRASAADIASAAAAVACYEDRNAPGLMTNGQRIQAKYNVPGARGQAQAGFPGVLLAGLPALRSSRAAGTTEDNARLDALLAIMAVLDDTCLLHRGGAILLALVKQSAEEILLAGGMGTAKGRRLFARLDATMLQASGSPGGSADMLAATLFLDSVLNAHP